jgi:predicted dehydrogenase
MLDVGLIGYGYAGRTFHAPLIDACAALRLAAVVTSQAPALAAAFPHVRAVRLEAMLADPSISLVVIATPNETHAPLARAALVAGKAVVIDKPFTVTVEEAEELVALARARRALLSVFHNRRWDSDFLTLRKVIAEGRLGDITRFESHFDRYRPQVHGRWRETAAPGAGAWFDLGPHLIDQAIQLFGMPLAISCDLAAQRPGAVADDYFHAVLRYERLRAILHADSLSAANELRFVVHGDRGSFLKHNLDPQEAQLRTEMRPRGQGWGADPCPAELVDGATGERARIEGVAGDYLAYYDAVAQALRGGPNPIPPREALEVMRVLEAGRRSSLERREIAIPSAPAS